MLDLLGPLLAAWSISYLGMVLLGPGISFGLVWVFFDTFSFGLDTGTFVIKMNHVDVSPHLCNVRLWGTIWPFGITDSVGIPGICWYALSRVCVVTPAATIVIVVYKFATVLSFACKRALLNSGEFSQMNIQAIMNSSWIPTSANWYRLNRVWSPLAGIFRSSIVSSPFVI